MPEDPPPYGFIWNHLKQGRVIPFLGAGASLGSRPSQAEWEEESATFLPNGRELAHVLAQDVGFPSDTPEERDDLAKVASYYVETIDRTGLVERLGDVFDREYEGGELHRFLADLPAPMLIVTTNYDDMIEKAFQAKGRPYHLVVHPTDSRELAASVLWWEPGASAPKDYPPQKLPLSLKETSIIYKMHGSVDRQNRRWNSFVITEEDYVDFLARMTGQAAIPARFLLDFRQRRFLFLGYGLRDWNLRVMLRNLKVALTGMKLPAAGGSENGAPSGEDLRSWAIQYSPSGLERTLWRARKVIIYDLTIDAFVAEMRKRM